MTGTRAALAVVALTLTGFAGPLAGAPPAAPPGVDASPAGRARRIVEAQKGSASLTPAATAQLAPIHADLESGDQRRVSAALAVVDEIVAAIERARRGVDEADHWLDGLNPLVDDLEPLLDNLRRTAVRQSTECL